MRAHTATVSCLLVACAFGSGCADLGSAEQPADVAASRESLTRPTAIWATYGSNCNPALWNNAGAAMSSWCRSWSSSLFGCSFPVGTELLGDPAPGCEKDMRAYWTCSDGSLHTSYVAGEAAGESLNLSCPNRHAEILAVDYAGIQDPAAVESRLRDTCDYSSECVFEEDAAWWPGADEHLSVHYSCRDASGGSHWRWADAERVGGGWLVPATLRLRMSCNYSWLD